jgi:hypothetical protein
LKRFAYFDVLTISHPDSTPSAVVLKQLPIEVLFTYGKYKYKDIAKPSKDRRIIMN